METVNYDNEMVKITNWLNSRGYNFDMSDGLWMEDCIDSEHKWRDVFCMMADWASASHPEGEQTVKCCECKKPVKINTEKYHCKECFNKENDNVVICECGDHIELHGKRDYQYKNGKYYCVDCMDVTPDCPDDCPHRIGRHCELGTNHCIRRATDYYRSKK